MNIRDEEIIQYLLNEADAVLARRVEVALQSDPKIAVRMHELRAALGLLDSLRASIDPPDDLVARTLARIDQVDDSQVDDKHADEKGADAEPQEVHQFDHSVLEQAALIAARQGAQHLSSATHVRLRGADWSTGTARSNRHLWDSVFLTLSVASLVCLMLPLMLEARSLSRRLKCAENLHILGNGLTQLAMLSPERRFPAIPTEGLERFAGRFVLQLKDHDLLESPSNLRCFSIPGTETSPPSIVCIPSTDLYLQAGSAQQAMWREELGGDYAYNFGVIDNGRVVGPRLEGRAQLAILADAPKIQGDRDEFYAHDGRGINIYYEDGHVAFSRLPRLSVDATKVDSESSGTGSRKAVVMVNNWRKPLDYPFRNLAGRQAHGLSPTDASLGPSSSAPESINDAR
ncbi:MAG: hypothetical protein IT423_06140 [Pirellulaceae bacterium]|nr:hypothetical protein [Pirellulaceae bacterium]